MLIIDIENDKKLSINNFEGLKSHQILQLTVSYCFSKDIQPGKLITIHEDDYKLEGLVDFLDNEKISHQMSERCRAVYEKIQKKKSKFQNFVDQANSFKDASFDPIDFQRHIVFLKSNVARNLRDHQKKAFYHLCKIKNGANFSVPGSGKTTVVISAYEKSCIDHELNLLLVIGPPACFGPWQKEFIETLGRKPSTTILAGGDREARKQEYYEVEHLSELYLTTFQTLMQDQGEVYSFLTHPNVNAFVVIDEAHYIKQINGSWATAVLNIARLAKRRCILTGTPIPKSYSDLFNLFDFLWPENTVVSEEEKGMLELYEKTNNQKKATEILEPAVGPLFYRVRKKDMGLKPQIFHEPIKIDMNAYEGRFYNAIVGKIKYYASAEDYMRDSVNDTVLRLKKGRMIRLRQIFSYSKLLDSAIDKYSERLLDDNIETIIYKYDSLEYPAKLNYLLKMVEEFQLQSQKVVIWANFINTIDLIEKTMLKRGLYCKKIYGQTPIAKENVKEEETRERIRDEFVAKNSGLNILIANPAACSESISLHKTCFNAIYYDLSYNCSQYLQSLDRIHRVGGSEKNEAHYYFLQYNNTVEGKILKNLNNKAQKMYELIEGEYNIYSLDMFDESDDLDINIYDELFS